MSTGFLRVDVPLFMLFYSMTAHTSLQQIEGFYFISFFHGYY